VHPFAFGDAEALGPAATAFVRQHTFFECAEDLIDFAVGLAKGVLIHSGE
jgi:hypothetical protein